jgi:preprotein translocase subunit SecD
VASISTQGGSQLTIKLNTRQHIAGASSQPLPSGSWEVAIEFNSTGSDAFTKLTKNLAGTGRTIGVFLDREPISTPTVGAQFAATGITGGKAVIPGNFTTETANDLAIQLHGGAMPLPIETIENRPI